jgi:hypothetical protein
LIVVIQALGIRPSDDCTAMRSASATASFRATEPKSEAFSSPAAFNSGSCCQRIITTWLAVHLLSCLPSCPSESRCIIPPTAVRALVSSTRTLSVARWIMRLHCPVPNRYSASFVRR